MPRKHSGKKPHYSAQKKREKFKQLHPEGRKAFAKTKRQKRLEKRLKKYVKKRK